MLALSPSISTTRDDHRSSATATAAVEFADIRPEDLSDFTAADEEVKSLALLEGIDYLDDLLIEIGNGDVLPDLEVDPEILGEYSGGSEWNTLPAPAKESGGRKPAVSGNVGESNGGQPVKTLRRGKKGNNKRKKSSYSQGKSKEDGKRDSNSEVKKKAKVDWTPELHRRFVQAVEQLGVDQAVPSRILELMGVDSLTRHNVASHLQKYRSHRKHLLAREAEAASWNLRRQAAASAAAANAVGGGGKKPWMAPTLGYPPMTTHVHHFRPLHVWGHPKWPKHKPNQSPPPPPVVVPPSWPVTAPPNPIYWHQTPVYPQPMVSPLGYGALSIPIIPSSNHSVYKSDTGISVLIEQSNTHSVPTDIFPSKESIDAAIGDVISKPRLPLPLGLKPPSLDSVMTELQRQGISKVPPLPP